MNLLQNELEPLLTPGTIVAHFKRDNYLKAHRLDADFDKNMYLYQVCGLATDVDNITCHYVVYQAMYGRREVFVRAINDFLSPAGTDIDKRHVPRFSVYAEPVEVINPQIPAPKKHNEAKKLHKKIKNLAAEVKKLREENDQLKKEAANTHALKKSVKNLSISVVPDTVREAAPISSPIVPIVPKTSAELPSLASMDMHLQSRKHQATMDTSGAVGIQGKYPREYSTNTATTDVHDSHPNSGVTDDTCTSTKPPIEPHSVKAQEIADRLCDKVEDTLLKEIPKELLK